jgi:poly(3-hydroxybutyrate) depolymerase
MKTSAAYLPLLFSGFVLFAQQVVVAEPSPGCKTAKYDPISDHYIQTTWNDRPVRLSMPRRYSPRRPTPLVIALHDQDSSPEQLMISSMMSNQNLNEQAIVLYPTSGNVQYPFP